MEQPISQTHSRQSVEQMLEFINRSMARLEAVASDMEEISERLWEVYGQNMPGETN